MSAIIRLVQTSKCRGCGADIGFIKMQKSTTMPVDVDGVFFTPDEYEGPETFVTIDGRVVRGVRRKNGSVYGFISHFATCPAAHEFRKGRHKGK